MSYTFFPLYEPIYFIQGQEMQVFYKYFLPNA
jgi:hypothetical protein